MLHLTVAFSLLRAFSAPQAAAGPEAPVIKAELKDVAAEGTGKPTLVCDGTTNLPDGAFLNAYIYYDLLRDGREVAKDTITVKGGKFSHEFTAFNQKNLPGKYITRLLFNPEFQNEAMPGFKGTRVDFPTQIGAPGDAEREIRKIRQQLAGEVQAFSSMGDEVDAKLKELQGKPAGAWDDSLKGWRTKTIEIQKRAHPMRVPEYRILNLDTVADGGLENLTGILLSAAKLASVGRIADTKEGLTRLRQTCEYLIDEVASPKLTEPGQILQLIDSARKLLKDALDKPDDPVLPLRRKFVEMNALLQKSLPEEIQPAVLDIGARSTAFFAALSDKQPNAKQLHAEVDQAFEKLLASLRRPKGS
jgi:hypothetical protein